MVSFLCMNVIQCDPSEPEVQAIEQAVQALRDGGVVAHPTDTCYGLAVDITNADALKRLYLHKGMELNKPVSILVSSLEEAHEYGVFSDMAVRLAQEFWPGPLTLVVPRTDKLPEFVNKGMPDVGIRVISDPVAVALLEAFGGPVTTTSANAHGKPSPYKAQDISMEPDLILDVGELVEREKPSTVLKIREESAITLRQGNLYFEL
jgi:L-threonylcarbamoyladenylate synthase